MSFKQPYQKAQDDRGRPLKTVHRASRKQRYSATVGYLKPKRYRAAKAGQQ